MIEFIIIGLCVLAFVIIMGIKYYKSEHSGIEKHVDIEEKGKEYDAELVSIRLIPKFRIIKDLTYVATFKYVDENNVTKYVYKSPISFLYTEDVKYLKKKRKVKITVLNDSYTTYLPSTTFDLKKIKTYTDESIDYEELPSDTDPLARYRKKNKK